ncbi:hypothetical protein F2Q70_00029776 [Brassica cretica]|uniref:Secreted protein n=1 Tax=Brassica cretica TaxID=69181 RepID=A0A8S9FHZ3_BRACR|nr:hypothetical protein F2Q70_00029776 [Brassica cretica]
MPRTKKVKVPSLALLALSGVIDLHHGHELPNQLRVEEMWVGAHVAHSQLHEHVLEVLSDAQLSNHIRVDELHRLNGNLQLLIVECAIIVVPLVPYRTVFAFQAFSRITRVSKVCKEWDGVFLALSWPRVLVANWWWGWSCAGAAGVESPLRSPFVHLQPKFTNEYTKSVKLDGLVVDIDQLFCVDIDQYISVKIDRCKWAIIDRYLHRENLQKAIRCNSVCIA